VNDSSPPRKLFRRFYFDTLTHDPQAARHLINIAGADRVVIGSDHPFDMATPDPVGATASIPNLTRAEREWVCSKTARKLLRER
jgi:aminocarboxymuconate-semialdehyde decarboxylase